MSETHRSFQLTGNVVDVIAGRVFPATVDVQRGRIARIAPISQRQATFLMPGFVDAHVHIESSMLVPSQFARAAVVHGTVASVSDPHEIANVLGTGGVRYMLEEAQDIPFHIAFGAPSCVPATSFETAGAAITVDQVASLLDDPRIGYLSEMMNFPGVLAGDADVMAKIEAARQRGKPVDGHAPGLRGASAEAYFAAGITTDHECVERDEAEEKIGFGVKVAVREGSAARNFDALAPLIDRYPQQCFLCSDDKHPDELLVGHIDRLARRAIDRSIDPMKVLRVACVNPVLHYGLDVGLLRPGDWADLIEVDSLERLEVLRTFVRGQLVAERGAARIAPRRATVVNRFDAGPTHPDQFRVPATSGRIAVIRAADGQLITRREVADVRRDGKYAVADVEHDVLKLAVVNRYAPAPPAVAFIRGFGLTRGALASSVAHDSHNIVAVGVDDRTLCRAVNGVIEAGGGLAVVDGDRCDVLPLPVAGLMATGSADEVGTAYARLDQMAKSMAAPSPLRAPFMTLSFMALLVIPELKLSDRGLFDGTRFTFTPLFV